MKRCCSIVLISLLRPGHHSELGMFIGGGSLDRGRRLSLMVFLLGQCRSLFHLVELARHRILWRALLVIELLMTRSIRRLVNLNVGFWRRLTLWLWYRQARDFLCRCVLLVKVLRGLTPVSFLRACPKLFRGRLRMTAGSPSLRTPSPLQQFGVSSERKGASSLLWSTCESATPIFEWQSQIPRYVVFA